MLSVLILPYILLNLSIWLMFYTLTQTKLIRWNTFWRCSTPKDNPTTSHMLSRSLTGLKTENCSLVLGLGLDPWSWQSIADHDVVQPTLVLNLKFHHHKLVHITTQNIQAKLLNDMKYLKSTGIVDLAQVSRARNLQHILMQVSCTRNFKNQNSQNLFSDITTITII